MITRLAAYSLTGLLMGGGAVAVAASKKPRDRGGPPPAVLSSSDSAIRIPGSEIDGRVVKTSGSAVWLEQRNGGVIELKVDSQTRFSDTSAKSASDLKEDQWVRAKFIIEDRTTNLATNISTGQSPHADHSGSKVGWYGSTGRAHDSSNPSMHGQGSLDDKGLIGSAPSRAARPPRDAGMP